MFKLQRTRNQNTLFAVNIADTPVTLKQGQCHQTWNDDVDPKQDYNPAKFERSCFHGVQEKANVNSFRTRKYANYLPWTCAKIKTSGTFIIF